MLIKKSQTILKHFIGSTLRAQKTKPCDTYNFFRSTAGQDFQYERGKRKEESRRWKEEGGRREEERGKRKEERGKRKL